MAPDSVLLRLLTNRAVWPSAMVTSEMNWRLERMGNVVEGGAGERLYLKVDVHGDVVGLLNDGGRLECDTEVFVLDLRDGGGGGVAEDLVEQLGCGYTVDGDAS